MKVLFFIFLSFCFGNLFLVEYTVEGDMINQDVKRYKLSASVEDALSWINTNKPKSPEIYNCSKLQIVERIVNDEYGFLVTPPIYTYPKKWVLDE
jgi:hypothetical protein